MIEIIPNLHPFVVHFLIALVVVSAVLHVIVSLGIFPAQHSALSAVANWNLWLGVGFGALAVLAGFYAYNTVAHDTPSHLAMTDHKNWAIATIGVCAVAAIFSIINARKQQPINWTVTVLVVVATSLILVTGFKGGELVYRHGLGVMSLPKSDSHAHAPGEEHDHGSSQGTGHDSLDGGHGHNDTGHGHDSLDSSHEHGHDDSHDHEKNTSGTTHEHTEGGGHQH